jgi:hypothetical protein
VTATEPESVTVSEFESCQNMISTEIIESDDDYDVTREPLPARGGLSESANR